MNFTSLIKKESINTSEEVFFIAFISNKPIKNYCFQEDGNEEAQLIDIIIDLVDRFNNTPCRTRTPCM